MYYEKVSLRHPGRWFALLFALISFSPGTSTGSEYFPSGFPDPYYTGYFVAMKEPSIFELRSDETKELYRFAWFRSFHHPLVVRIESRGDGGVLRLARFRRIERKPTQLVDEKLIT